MPSKLTSVLQVYRMCVSNCLKWSTIMVALAELVENVCFRGNWRRLWYFIENLTAPKQILISFDKTADALIFWDSLTIYLWDDSNHNNALPTWHASNWAQVCTRVSLFVLVLVRWKLLNSVLFSLLASYFKSSCCILRHIAAEWCPATPPPPFL